MPLGRHKKPFSSKQKKEQLQAKREKKRNKQFDTSSTDSENDLNEPQQTTSQTDTSTATLAKHVSTKLINQQPCRDLTEKELMRNRFNLIFVRESQDELKRKKKQASKTIQFRSESDLEIEIEEVYKPSSPLDMPIRPKWSYDMTKEQLESQEKKYFSEYLNQIFENFKDNELSYFEMNLETWRQLWRVVEISDIILLIVDIRFPALHFPPKFYEYCTQTLKKDVILILNKIDLVPASVVVAWKHYFLHKYPNLHVILFSSSKQIKHKKKRAKKEAKSADDLDQEYELEIKALAAEINTAKAHRQLYECVKKIVGNQVDLTNWSNMTEELVKKSTIAEPGINLEGLDITQEETGTMDDLYFSNVERKKFENGFVTIGCCGFPNVGKSSLLNSLNGRKVVSVSRTPGHTKHLQTIFLTKNVRLCDCPGLVFPSLVCKPLQILAGIYPIAQLQEPYSSIRYLAERVNAIDILKLKHPTETHAEKEAEWSPLDICEAWALKRGFFTAKASRPDTYRAANELLRMALDGVLCLSLKPKNYSKDKLKWEDSPETTELNKTIFESEALANAKRSQITEYKVEESESSESEDEMNPYVPVTLKNTNRMLDEFSSSESQNDGDVSSNAYENPYSALTHD
ncbi:unnamed protein product [Brachionus calyciflorus]|uniref:Guanine nucleotide-binding protein-like 1 n=1 Tax=Brachionus calyciflorus TaxID=104777 RepID=A0A813MST1_9BILA|nr:unnamed protein product [Brachionus calyciflorus]